MATSLEYAKLAQTLPPKLLKFFAKYPPSLVTSAGQSDSTTSIATSATTSPIDPNTNNEESSFKSALAPSNAPNPFKPHKHPETGRWHDPVYSLRRQADLAKMAKVNGVGELLPYSKKSLQERSKRREEQGLRVRGTGVGQKVKGKSRERTMKGRLEQRKQAILGMPAMIQQWKQASQSIAFSVISD